MSQPARQQGTNKLSASPSVANNNTRTKPMDIVMERATCEKQMIICASLKLGGFSWILCTEFLHTTHPTRFQFQRKSNSSFLLTFAPRTFVPGKVRIFQNKLRIFLCGSKSKLRTTTAAAYHGYISRPSQFF